MKKSLHLEKRIFALIAVAAVFNIGLFATPYFNGQTGIGTGIHSEKDSTKPEFLLDGFFSGQFDLSTSFLLRAGASIYTTESITSEPLFQHKNAIFSIDELSLTYRNFLGPVSQYIGVYIGNYDPIGSDIFLQRQFGIDPFNSKLTESMCGVNQASIFDNSGIGGTYYIKLPANIALATYLYYNTLLSLATDSSSTDSTEQSLNVDFRLAGAWPSVAIDLAFGITMPMEKSITKSNGSEEKVVLLIRRGDLRMGFSAFFGSSNSSSLLFQTGISQLIVDPSTLSDKQAISLENVYIFIEPRFITKHLSFSFAIYNMTLENVSNLFYITNPTGVSLNVSTPWVLVSSNRCQFGIIGNVSCKETLDKVVLDENVLKENLQVDIVPYGSSRIANGILNYSLSIDCLSIHDFDSFLQSMSVIIGYKSQL